MMCCCTSSESYPLPATLIGCNFSSPRTVFELLTALEVNLLVLLHLCETLALLTVLKQPSLVFDVDIPLWHGLLLEGYVCSSVGHSQGYKVWFQGHIPRVQSLTSAGSEAVATTNTDWPPGVIGLQAISDCRST